MTGRAVAAIAAAALALVFCCIGGLISLAGTASACSLVTTPSSTAGRYDTEQLHHARIIVTVGAQRGVPVRGQVIAVATAIQESGLRNLGHLGERNDHDSLGLFQQRPSQGWGTPQQIMDPVHAAGAFYARLVTIAGWERMPLTQAAQAVQRSAYPDAYAKWEHDATVLVGLAAGTGGSPPASIEQCVSAAGWMKPVNGPIVSGYGPRGDAFHHGVDIGAGKGVPIHAAASGIVIQVRCNAHLLDGTPYSCDQDGHPLNVKGCGWYAEVLHNDGTVTRYCHMVRRPTVQIGQQVAVGQVIGQVGSSGNSSGPHLHLETHAGRPPTSTNAVDPIGFFADRGIDLRAS